MTCHLEPELLVHIQISSDLHKPNTKSIGLRHDNRRWIHLDLWAWLINSKARLVGCMVVPFWQLNCMLIQWYTCISVDISQVHLKFIIQIETQLRLRDSLLTTRTLRLTASQKSLTHGWWMDWSGVVSLPASMPPAKHQTAVPSGHRLRTTSPQHTHLSADIIALPTWHQSNDYSPLMTCSQKTSNKDH